MPDPAPPTPAHDPHAAFAEPNYRLFAAGFLASSFGLQLLATAIAWEIYDRTRDPLALGWIGLARALPVILFALPAGHVIDHFDRRRVLVITQAAMAVTAAALALVSFFPASPLPAFYAALAAMGCARAFNGPSRATLLPLLVPDAVFHNAVTWNSGIFHFAATAGPIAAGILLASMGVYWPIYALTAAGCLAFALTATFLSPAPAPRATGPLSFDSLFAGAGFVWREKTILGTLTLDLFAVLLGGATALLPIYAREILHTDEIGYGWLRAATPLGAVAATLLLTRLPPFARAGPTLLWSVAAYGVCMIAFGFSTLFWLSLAALFLSGAADSVSVVVRHVLVQVRTPNHLRGRVSAVNSVFIESSNELGAFESGAVARIFSPVISVVSGGIGTLVVVAAVALAWPQVRRLRRLHEQPHSTQPPAPLPGK